MAQKGQGNRPFNEAEFQDDPAAQAGPVANVEPAPVAAAATRPDNGISSLVDMICGSQEEDQDNEPGKKSQPTDAQQTTNLAESAIQPPFGQLTDFDQLSVEDILALEEKYLDWLQ